MSRFPIFDLRFTKNAVRRKWKNPLVDYGTWTPEAVEKRSVSRWTCKNKILTNSLRNLRRSNNSSHKWYSVRRVIVVVISVVYYESIKRELKIKSIYECRCDERLQTKTRKLRASHTLLAVSSATGWGADKPFFFLVPREIFLLWPFFTSSHEMEVRFSFSLRLCLSSRCCAFIFDLHKLFCSLPWLPPCFHYHWSTCFWRRNAFLFAEQHGYVVDVANCWWPG